jgi:phospholipase C
MTENSHGLTRRTALKAAGAGALAVSLSRGGVPAWAKSVATTSKLRQPGSRPFPKRKEGSESMPQIEHVVVLMMENHTFDSFLGMVPHQVKGRSHVDGLARSKSGKLLNTNKDETGKAIRANHAPSPCQRSVSQNWNHSHEAYAGGRNSGFVLASGPQAMNYWDKSDLPFSYSLARHFPIGQRYFSSVLGQTYPNRRFLFSGTASGTIATNAVSFGIPAANGTIFDRFDQFGVDWKSYYTDLPSLAIIQGQIFRERTERNFRKIDQFYADAKAGNLPQFSFVEPNYNTQSQENPQDIQLGERFIAQVTNALLHSPNWSKTALFINYDEGGGYYDHVPPPKAIVPDDIAPILKPGDTPAKYDRYGFRTPFFVVSPWAKKNYVSKIVQDHTSVLAFLERKWNLGAMTRRDANAADLTDYFDFRKAAFHKPPKLAAAPDLAKGLAACKADGLTPPL